MATILKQFDWKYISKSGDTVRSANYPWAEWFDGRIRQLEQGVDFDVPAISLERVIRTSANRRGVKVRVRTMEDGSIVLQKHDDTDAKRVVTKSPSKREVMEQAAARAEAVLRAERAAKRAAARLAKKAETNGNGHKAVSGPTQTVKYKRRRRLVAA